jgi:hypothetical protein
MGFFAVCFALMVQAQDFEATRRVAEQGDVWGTIQSWGDV